MGWDEGETEPISIEIQFWSSSNWKIQYTAFSRPKWTFYGDNMILMYEFTDFQDRMMQMLN